MHEIERKIYVDEEILLNEYDFFYGKRKNEKVKFLFYQVKKNRITERTFSSYKYALNLARMRASDGRYKNFEFLIKSINETVAH